MKPEAPWEIHHDLTADRLIKIAELIVRGRNDAIFWQNRDIGDDNWILGCRAFRFGMYQIISAEGKENYEWLSVVDGSKRFIFKIGAVPVRFYRGLAEEPTSRTLRRSYSELEQLSLVFPDERKSFSYRLAVETDEDGEVLEVKFVGLLGSTPAFCWTIPLEPKVLEPVLVIEPVHGVELAAPIVTVPGDEVIEGDEGGIFKEA